MAGKVKAPLGLLVLLMMTTAFIARAEVIQAASVQPTPGSPGKTVSGVGGQEGHEATPAGSVMSACTGAQLSLSWTACLNSPDVINQVIWFHQDTPPLLIAVATDGSLVSTAAFTGRVQQTTNAGITLHDVTTSDAGNYSVEVWMEKEDGSIEIWTASVYVLVTECANTQPNDASLPEDMRGAGRVVMGDCQDSVEDRLGDLQREVKELMKKNNDLTEKNKDLTEKNNDLTEKNNDLTEKNNDLTEKNNDLTQENVDLTGNVALSKVCNMSSTWQSNRSKQLAGNGDTAGQMNENNCVHTDVDNRDAYWEVDLGQPYAINRLVSYGRDNWEQRMSDITVTVDGQLCYTYPSNVTSRREDFNCDVGVMTGTTVRLTKVTPTGDDYFINLCEFEVYSCVDGYYGQDCQHDCGAGCDDVCNKANGTCSCRVGWGPPLCQQVCEDGRYGQDCTQTCSDHCVDNTSCDKLSGRCTCQPGYRPPICDEMCEDGRYGQDCTQTCSDHCVNTTSCDKQSGNCTCQLGYKPPLCNEVCEDGRYGQDCTQTCSDHCVDTTTCDKQSGSCTCQPGYKPTLCDVCEDGRYGQDCTQTCSDHCVDITSCDKQSGSCTCKLGYKPPLCNEVCEDGRYGQDCTQTCSDHCMDITSCDKLSGSCTCQAGYRPPLCDEEEVSETEDLSSTCSNGSTNRAVAIAVGVVLAVLITVNVVLVAWLWRRQWILPCAEMTSSGSRQLATRGATADCVELPQESPKSTEEPGYTEPYDVLRMSDVGLKSVYSDIDRHGNLTTSKDVKAPVP